MEHDIVVEPDGTVRFVYADDLAEVFAGERLHTERASHVEPSVLQVVGQHGWIADMSPSGGPVLTDGVRPFATRQAALDAERAWLREERGL